MERECTQCRRAYTAPRKTSKFCSRECQQGSLVRTESRVCSRSGCGNPFDAKPHDKKEYCSRSCAAKVNNERTPKRKLEGRCVGCGKRIPSSRVRCPECRRARPRKRQTREQLNTYMRERYADVYPERKERALSYLGGVCLRCGGSSKLEFDHVNPRDKAAEVTDLLDTHAWETIQKELDKCQLLCKECHKIKTRRDYREGKIQARKGSTTERGLL